MEDYKQTITQQWRQLEEKIDLTGLKDEDIRLLKEFVDFLREKARAGKGEEATKISYRSWPLGRARSRDLLSNNPKEVCH